MMEDDDVRTWPVARLRELWDWDFSIGYDTWMGVCDEIERLRARVRELEAERADLLTDEQAYWLYGMNPW